MLELMEISSCGVLRHAVRRCGMIGIPTPGYIWSIAAADAGFGFYRHLERLTIMVHLTIFTTGNKSWVKYLIRSSRYKKNIL